MTDHELKVCKLIADRRNAMIDDLSRYVAIPTGKGYRPGLDQFRELLISRFQQLDTDIELVEPSPRPDWLTYPTPSSDGDGEPDGSAPIVVARKHANQTGPRIMLAGHMDTVFDPNDSFRSMTIAPDGRSATGPGVVDMKGGIVIALHVLESLAEQGVEVNWTFLLNCDEETGSFASEQHLRRIAGECDIGIAIEPALPDGALAIERMGSGQCKIEVFGRSAHAGREFEKGVSAVTRLGEILVALGKMAEPKDGMIVNAGPLQGGSVTNAVPDYAACWVNVRYRAPKQGDILAGRIDALVSPPDAMPRVVVHRRWNRPAKPCTDPVRNLAEFTRRTAEDLGQSLPFASTGGVCDGNIMQDAGLPTLDTLGVRGGNLHRTDEFIELDSLVERGQLLAVLLSRLVERR